MTLSYDFVISLLGMYSEKNMARKCTCTPCIVHCRTIYDSKTWKQCEWPSREEWIKKMWFIYTKEFYTAIKKNEIMPGAAA